MQLNSTTIAQHLGNYDQGRPVSIDQQLARLVAMGKAATRRDDQAALATLKTQYQALKAQIAAAE